MCPAALRNTFLQSADTSACGSPRVVIYGRSQGIARSTRKDTQRGPDGLLPVWSLQQTIDHLTETENTASTQIEICVN